jgi:RecB family exonuclease
MHRAIAECAGVAPGEPRRAVLVPTEGAAGALRRTLPDLAAGVEIVTREGFYARLHEGLGGSPPLLSDFDREVLFRRAADRASEGGAPAPFRLRSGLIVEILAFYDELRRRNRTVADFDRLMTDSLIGSVDTDRGAERMFRQTRFLAAAFVEFERRVDGSGALDEHGLRRRLLHADAMSWFSGIVLTVADQSADARGIWTVDYDLIARMNGVERIDVIATENVLATGFHQRIHDLLPGIEESRRDASMPTPVLVAPAAGPGEVPLRWFVCRDREEELAEVARWIRAADDPGRSAAIIPRPLPYLYLARHVFEDAHVAYRASDSLPLAVEPFAAAVDLVLAFLTTQANRASIVDLLGSPHWQFAELPGPDMSVRERVAALDVALRQEKYLGGWDRLAALTLEGTKAVDALRAAAAAAEVLRPVREASKASEQIRALLTFVAAHERPVDPAASWHARHLRARGAVLDALASLAKAHATHDDTPLAAELLAATIRRWIESQTFARDESIDAAPSARGVALLDVSSAAYADVDDMRLLGLVESDWPDRSRRSIFYPASLLTQLGWPNETDRLAATRARFRDLLQLPRRRVSLSTFTLENDAIVSPSPFLEEVDTCGLAIERQSAGRPRVFVHEAVVEDPPDADAVRDAAAQWLELRMSRSPASDEAFHGAGGPRAPGAYAVSHLERYLECPFKYFAAHVLRLDEERDDESGLSPQERGQLIHAVFEEFFAAWNQRGGKAITATNLAEAVELFETVAEATIAELPDADRALERTYLLGSAAAAGLAERAFNFEIEQDIDVVERLLEHRLDGEFEFAGSEGPRTLRLRAKADRIDLLRDGTLRVIDYKLGRAPKSARALQLPVYGVCAEQHLEGRHGRNWTVSRAGYVAFKEKNSFVSLGASSSLKEALEEGQERLLAAVGGIERGEFPPRPEEPFLCTRCGYSGVCRKDYVGDE